MELSYIWVSKFRNIESQGFNLSSRYLFNYNHQIGKLDITENPKYISNLFGERVSNITGIVGQNAAGKTNLLELICYCLNGGNTKIDSPFFIVYQNSSGKLNGQACDMEVKKYPAVVQFEKYTPKGSYCDSIFFSNAFDGRRHDFDKETKELTTNSFFDNKFGENFLTNYKYDLQSQIGFINSSKMKLLGDIESQLNTQDFSNLKPTHISLTSPTWGNIRSRSVAFDKKVKSLIDKDITELKDFCLSYRSKITSNKSGERSILYYTAFLLFIDFVLNEFFTPEFKVKKSEKLSEPKKKKLIHQLDQLQLRRLTDSPINEIHRIITIELSKYIDQNWPHAIERSKFWYELGQQDFDFLVDKTYQGTYSNRKIGFKINYNEEVGNFVNQYLQTTTNLNLTYNIDWEGISSGHKAYLGLFSRFYSILKDLKKDSAVICIDEGDLYFHPKWQTEFVYKLIEILPNLLEERQVQIILTTHSPFLVSDLPKSNLVFLQKIEGLCKVISNTNIEGETFGGNIGELYLDAFFLKGSLISEFAASKIKPIIEKVKKQTTLNATELLLVDQIGEKLLKNFIKSKLPNDPLRSSI